MSTIKPFALVPRSTLNPDPYRYEVQTRAGDDDTWTKNLACNDLELAQGYAAHSASFLSRENVRIIDNHK